MTPCPGQPQSPECDAGPAALICRKSFKVLPFRNDVCALHSTGRRCTPKPVKLSEKPENLLRFDLENENETVRNGRERVRQCEALGEYATAEQIRESLVNEQVHQIDLATALSKNVAKVITPRERA
jgi:hypothetical protein